LAVRYRWQDEQQMARKSSRGPRPSEIVMHELALEQGSGGLREHLNGCLTAYQIEPSYGAAVYFALEAIWGIAQEARERAKAGTLNPDQMDAEWILRPMTSVPVPWMWIFSLGVAWERYKTEGGTLGQVFGLEGGQGKSPIGEKLAQMLDERAIARWIWWRVEQARAAGQKIRIEDVVQDAAEKFDKSDVTIRRAWTRFGGRERQRQAK
jgi:hypothetical protein